MERILSITGREILNAKGKPTVEAELVTESGMHFTASVPSGTSTGAYEAFELYDGGSRFRGFGTRKAAANISEEINECLKGMDVSDQVRIDEALIALDGTSRKTRLGGNSVLAASAVCAKAGAAARGLPLYRHLKKRDEYRVPHVVSTVIAGGSFSTSGLEFEDYLVLLDGFSRFEDGLLAICDIRRYLGELCANAYGVVAEDAGALAAPCRSTTEAFDLMLKAASMAGAESFAHLGLDVAAVGMYDGETEKYKLGQGLVGADELLLYYEKLAGQYPLTYIEDPFEENDFEHFAVMTKAMKGVSVVGDDLFATNIDRLRKGIEMGAGNMLLMKVNQTGTITETLRTAELAEKSGIGITASLRSGETTDDLQADVAVAAGALQMKLGSPVRGERNAKYNRLWTIERMETQQKG